MTIQQAIIKCKTTFNNRLKRASWGEYYLIIGEEYADDGCISFPGVLMLVEGKKKPKKWVAYIDDIFGEDWEVLK